MMTGRKPLGTKLVWHLEGPEETLARLEVLLESLFGLPIQQACRRLGIGKAMLNRLRMQALQGAVDALLPQRRGRPPGQEDRAELAAQVAAMRREIEDLRAQLKVARVKQEVGAILPLGTRAGGDEALKKTKRRKRQSRMRRPR
jgi:ribosomal protein L29